MSFFKKKCAALTEALLSELKKGVTPEKLGQSFAWGVTLGIFPVLGLTTVLCGLAGVRLKLNQVALQTINYLVYPFQLALLIPFYRLGELIFQRPPLPLELSLILSEFKTNFWGASETYAVTGLMGVVAWFLVAPLVYGIVNYFSYRLLRRLTFLGTRE